MTLRHAIGTSLLASALLVGCKDRSAGSPRSGSEPSRETVTPSRPAEDASRLSGSLEVSVSSADKLVLPEGTMLRVTLSDVSKADAPAVVVAEQVLTPTGTPPFIVTLTYDPAKIQNRSSYAVSARFENKDKLLFTTDTVQPALTGGAPKSQVNVTVRPVPTTGG